MRNPRHNRTRRSRPRRTLPLKLRQQRRILLPRQVRARRRTRSPTEQINLTRASQLGSTLFIRSLIGTAENLACIVCDNV